jgi:hypothetical protein
MYYYHIPAVTGVFLNVSDLIEYSKAHSLLPRLTGAPLCRCPVPPPPFTLSFPNCNDFPLSA